MARSAKPPSPTWRTFLQNHAASLVAIDFCVVPTVTFQMLYIFIVLRHDRRRVVHFNVTTHPTAAWVSQQIRESFPFDESPPYLIRDRDGIYGEKFQRCLRNMEVEEVLTAPHSPWQNPYVERLIGTLRRECLDHVIVLNAAHLKRILTDFWVYYHRSCCHASLQGNSPDPREVEPPERGKVVAISQVDGLHHRYRHCA
jgi:putative transposase